MACQLITFTHHDTWQQLPRPAFLLQLDASGVQIDLPKVDWLLLIGQAGRFSCLIDGQEQFIAANQGLLINTAMGPCFHAHGDDRCVIFGYKGAAAWTRELLESLPCPLQLRSDSSSLRRLLAFFELDQNEVRINELDGNTLVVSLLLSLVHHNTPDQGGSSPVIRQACRALQDAKERSYDGTAIAELVGLSPNHFCNVFTQVMGVSPGQYHKRLRLAYAAQLLKTSQLSVHDIATRLDYCNASAFARAFRSHYRMSPQEFRDHASIPLG